MASASRSPGCATTMRTARMDQTKKHAVRDKFQYNCNYVSPNNDQSYQVFNMIDCIFRFFVHVHYRSTRMRTRDTITQK